MRIFNQYLLNQVPKFSEKIFREASSEKVKNLFLKAVEGNESTAFSSSEIEQLVDFLSDLFAAYGVYADSEPNPFGLFLDSLIGALVACNQSK